MDKKQIQQLNQAQILEKLETTNQGLSQKEAAKRLVEYGPNILGKKTANAFRVFIRQFESSLVFLLIVAAIISYSIQDVTDGTVILVILLINTLLGFFQEYKSERIIDKLAEFISKQVRIKRDGNNQLLDESQIVPGDLITVREGDIVPADLRLLEANNLEVNESQLTGESLPLTKSIPADGKTSDQTLLFAGSFIEKGAGSGIAYATAKNTQLGNIATLSSQTKKQTEYEKALATFSSFLMKVVLLGLALVFIFKIILDGGIDNVTSPLLFIIAMAVAVVPEVLPVIATVSLSHGALKLAKKHVVVKRLSALEDLGNVNMLCTDKTGTITENKMVISKITSSDNDLFQKLAFAAIAPLKGRKRRTQNSYDDAFLSYVSATIKDEAKYLSIIKEVPFDPEDRRRRVVLKDSKNNKYYLLVIGAPEVLLELTKAPGKTQSLKTIAAEGKMGLHQLAAAYKEISYKDDFDILKNEAGLSFLGYASLTDPLRPSVKSTIEHAESLGVQIKILTGDSREVAEYIGGQIGLLKNGSKVYLGSELSEMSKDEFKVAVNSSNIFARVSPEDKFNIIKTLKDNYVVAYQGDGINDAPALKMADVAIAVNSATDIAKENADIILLNKSLEVIINGIKYGRATFININKYIKYTMVSNFGNFFALSVLYLLSSTLPLLPIQVLLVTVVTDIPLVTISSDEVEDEEVVAPERHNVRELILISLILGIPTAIFEVFYFLFIQKGSLPYVQTSLYLIVMFMSLIIFYAIRNKGPFYKAKMPATLLNVSFILGFIFSFIIIYIPAFQKWFSFVPLMPETVGMIIGLTLVYFLALDATKVWYYKVSDHMPEPEMTQKAAHK